MFHTLITKHEATPQKAMMKVGGRIYTYGLMAEQIARCTAWLNTLELRAGSRALLYVTNPFTHWILTFALERVGVTSCAVSAPEAIGSSLEDLQAEILFTRSAPDTPVGRPTYVIDQAWYDALAAFPAAPPPPRVRAPEDILRIIVTSGTTGVAKKIPLTRAVVEARIRNAQAGGYYSRPDLKMAATFAPSAVAGWINVLYCFNEGGTLIAGRPWIELIAEGEVNLFRLAPAHLQALLAELPEDFTPPEDLRLSIIGGSLSPALAERAAERLTPDILINYGATETGTVVMGLIADLDRPDAAGFICPWATVEAVDPDGRPVPVDEVGEIRIRSDNLCDGYLEDPEATAVMFRDGWFWTGDLGQISADGRLAIVGRTNDLMNIGGGKVLATRVEALALTLPGVEDVAVFPGPDQDGLATAYVAYVRGADFDPQALSERVCRSLGRVPVLREVATIPRNGMGKIQRDLLPRLI